MDCRRIRPKMLQDALVACRSHVTQPCVEVQAGTSHSSFPPTQVFFHNHKPQYFFPPHHRQRYHQQTRSLQRWMSSMNTSVSKPVAVQGYQTSLPILVVQFHLLLHHQRSSARGGSTRVLQASLSFALCFVASHLLTVRLATYSCI